MRAVVWSSTALDQYKRAISYLAERNGPAAAHMADRIRQTLANLATRPLGRPGQVEGTFEKIVQKTPYLLVFAVVGDELQVIRLFHMAQDRTSWGVSKDGV